MKKYGRKWRQNNPEEARKKRNNPNYFAEKRQLKQQRKIESLKEETQQAKDFTCDCEDITYEVPITSIKQLRTGPFMPLSIIL